MLYAVPTGDFSFINNQKTTHEFEDEMFIIDLRETVTETKLHLQNLKI